MSNFMSNSDALEVFGAYAEDIKKGKGVIAVRETSPATAAHSVGEYIRYNGTTYKVKSAISIGDSLILNTNIEANGLPEGMTIFTPETVGDPTVAFLDDLGDVDISDQEEGDIISFNSSTGKFENGHAKVSDFASASDLSDLGKDVEDISEKVDAIYEFIDYDDIAGVEVDYENKSFKRLAGAVGLTAGIDFNKFSNYANMKRCNLDSNGQVTKYRGESGYTETDANTMVEIPHFYYRFEPIKVQKATKGFNVRKARYYISANFYPGFKLFPWFNYDGEFRNVCYYSAFEGSLYDVSAAAYLRNDEQVMDNTVDLLVSVSGSKPASGLSQDLTKAKLEQMANNFGSGYHVSTVYAEMAVTWLMLIEYGVFDFQRTKLGYGVVSKASGSGNESVNTGLATSLDETGSTYAIDTTRLIPICYRWIENPYGNIWKNIQAINIWGDGSMQGGEYFICTDTSYNESKHDDNYDGVGFYMPAAGDYISAFGFGKEEYDWLLLPSEATGANNALPVGDYTWLTANLNGYRIAILGGSWFDGLNAGRSYWYCNTGVGSRFRYFGGRLEYQKPKAS